MRLEKINEENWVCPICGQAPMGANFRIRFMESRGNQTLAEWVENPRVGYFEDTSISSITCVEDLMGHRCVFEGCFHCFSKETKDNHIAKSLFKSFWHILKNSNLGIPKHSSGGVACYF